VTDEIKYTIKKQSINN